MKQDGNDDSIVDIVLENERSTPKTIVHNMDSIKSTSWFKSIHKETLSTDDYVIVEQEDNTRQREDNHY